jgi:hypothetical protein
MTVSVKAPTSTTGSIQLNGSDVLTIESDRSVDIDSNTLHVDATNNRVGIGTSSPSGKTHIQTASSGGTADVNADELVLEGTGNMGMNFLTSNTGANRIYFGDSDNALSGVIKYDHSLDAMFFNTSATERMRIDSNGQTFVTNDSNSSDNNNANFCVNHSVSTRGINLHTTGTGVSERISFQNDNGTVGTIATSGSATSYNTSSDYRLKENVLPMSGSIDRLKQLKPSTWSWIQDGSHGEGFLAHEAQAVVPESVTGTKDAMRTEEYEVTPAVTDDEGNVTTAAVMGTREVPDYQGIDQSKLVPLLTAALQEAITKIEDLETRIQALESA